MEYKELKEGLTYTKLKEVYEKKGYAFFDEGKYNVNVFGVRIKTDTNQFDDAVGVAYRGSDGKTRVKLYKATTDPGRTYLHDPINNQIGVAILVEGQYRGSHVIGHHQGKYLALCQAKPVLVYRDNDRDSEHDMNPLDKRKGIFGINIHRSNPYTESEFVDKWSAGCQVLKRKVDFDSLMDIVIEAKTLWGNSFTYTLFNIDDFKVE